MRITVELPNDFVEQPNSPRMALEALAVAGFRAQDLTHFQASQLLGLTRFEFDGLLNKLGILDHAYDSNDLEMDLDTMRRLEAESRSRR